MADLSSLQESYIKGLRQITGVQSKKMATAPTERPGLGSRGKKQQSGKEYAYYSRADRLKTAFAVSNKALIASFLFWLLLMYGFYVLGGYTLMAFRVMWSDQDLQGECQSRFSSDPEENFHTVLNYPKGDAGPYVARFASDRGDYQDYPQDSKALPPMVMGVTSGQFFLFQGFLKHVQEDLLAEHKDIKIIVYDLGLYQRERTILQQFCGCEVRSIEHQLYPDHVADPSNFAWRPIALQTVMDEFGAAMYVEPTTRFKTSNSLNMVRSRGTNHFLLWDTPAFTSTTGYTNKHTFTYLNETRCLFSDVGVIDSQVMVVYKTNTTWQRVMRPWLKCALNVECLAPRWSRWESCLHFRRPRTTGCHRFDLSALTIVLNRGLQLTTMGHKNRYTPPRFFYSREDEPSLFPQQPWTNTQLLILFLTPWVFMALAFRKIIMQCLDGTILKEH